MKISCKVKLSVVAWTYICNSVPCIINAGARDWEGRFQHGSAWAETPSVTDGEPHAGAQWRCKHRAHKRRVNTEEQTGESSITKASPGCAGRNVTMHVWSRFSALHNEQLLHKQLWSLTIIYVHTRAAGNNRADPNIKQRWGSRVDYRMCQGHAVRNRSHHCHTEGTQT